MSVGAIAKNGEKCEKCRMMNFEWEIARDKLTLCGSPCIL